MCYIILESPEQASNTENRRLLIFVPQLECSMFQTSDFRKWTGYSRHPCQQMDRLSEVPLVACWLASLNLVSSRHVAAESGRYECKIYYDSSSKLMSCFICFSTNTTIISHCKEKYGCYITSRKLCKVFGRKLESVERFVNGR